MKWLLLFFTLTISYYTYTFGRWSLKQGYRRGSIGVFFLAAFVLALSVYALFIKQSF